MLSLYNTTLLFTCPNLFNIVGVRQWQDLLLKRFPIRVSHSCRSDFIPLVVRIVRCARHGTRAEHIGTVSSTSEAQRRNSIKTYQHISSRFPLFKLRHALEYSRQSKEKISEDQSNHPYPFFRQIAIARYVPAISIIILARTLFHCRVKQLNGCC